MNVVARAIVLAALGTKMLSAQEHIERQSKFFTIQLHAGELSSALATRLADEALAAAERALPVISKLYKEPAQLRVIHVYADEAEYRKEARKLGALQFPVEHKDAAWSAVQGFDASIKPGVPFGFALAVGDAVRITIDGVVVGTLPVAGRTMHAPWGLSVIHGMAWFDALKVEASAPASAKKK